MLKPGGHLLAFSNKRTSTAWLFRIEDAGFEIRDMLAWVYGLGFRSRWTCRSAIDERLGPSVMWLVRSSATNIGKQSDRKRGYGHDGFVTGGTDITDSTSQPPPPTPARQWSGWGTALKPALEPITMARKPLVGTRRRQRGRSSARVRSTWMPAVWPTQARLVLAVPGTVSSAKHTHEGWNRPWKL